MGVLTRVEWIWDGFSTSLDFRHSFEETVLSLPLVAFYPARHIMIILYYMVHMMYIYICIFFFAHIVLVHMYILQLDMICDTD